VLRTVFYLGVDALRDFNCVLASGRGSARTMKLSYYLHQGHARYVATPIVKSSITARTTVYLIYGVSLLHSFSVAIVIGKNCTRGLHILS
jgi:hypothetical protein